MDEEEQEPGGDLGVDDPAGIEEAEGHRLQVVLVPREDGQQNLQVIGPEDRFLALHMALSGATEILNVIQGEVEKLRDEVEQSKKSRIQVPGFMPMGNLRASGR